MLHRTPSIKPSNARLLISNCLIFVGGLCISLNVSAQIEKLSIVAAANLAADFSAEVDIVFVYSQDVLNQLPFEQFAWISTREEQIAQFGDKIEVLSFIVNSQFNSEQTMLPARQSDAVAVLVFASHEDPVAEGIDITNAASVVLRIEEWGVTVD